MRVSLIIAAGGSGTRFKAGRRAVPSKLFFPLQGKPVLAHAVAVFQGIPQIKETVVAITPAARSSVCRLIRDEEWRGVKLVRGGKTRAESVLKAFRKTDKRYEWVLVHDGARPLVTRRSVERLFRAVGGRAGAILAKKVVLTVKEAGRAGEILRTIDRNALYEAETPQLARRRFLEKAYRENPEALRATDEAGLLESIGGRVKIVPHTDWNPKITTMQDLKLAEVYLGASASYSVRVGFGRDTHRLVPGRRFYLGGVRIPYKKGALGHSDGDALLHAVADAVLGAIGRGDIGDWFSDRDPKFKNMRSEKILRAVLAEARRLDFEAVHADTVVLLEKPRLGPHKKRIRARVAGMLGVSVANVSVKAKTMEGLGPEGEGLAVTCEALVTLRGRSV